MKTPIQSKNKPALTLTPTPIHPINVVEDNTFYIKRDDMTGLALGGNKARKLEYYFDDAAAGNYNHIVTYGTAQSNHCRVTAIAAAMWGLPCTLILAKSDSVPLYNGNYFLFNFFDAEILWSAAQQVSTTIDRELDRLKDLGNKPYFIPGGGHGCWGTHAYLQAYRELEKQKKELGIQFDYIFLASGTGSTQSGLIIGNILSKNTEEKIIGISIARTGEKGIPIIMESVAGYIKEKQLNISIDETGISFIDDYIGKGYGDIYPEIMATIKQVAAKTGVMLDPVYTGKAFYGMLDYLKKRNIKNKNILFIHTGGIPLLFYHSEKFKDPVEIPGRDHE